MAAEPFRVLIGIDSSENANHAFDYFMKHMYKEGSELILLHVAEMPHTMLMSGMVWEEVIQKERDRTVILEKQIKEKLEKHGVTGRITATFGVKPGETLVEAAEKEKVDLVVVGSRGQGRIRRTILGSVSDYVLHHAQCAVLVCRHESDHHHHHHGLHFHGFHLPGFHHHDKDKHKDKHHDKHHEESKDQPKEEATTAESAEEQEKK